MKIAILGGGNGAHAVAADLSLRGHEVNMCELPQFQSNVAQTMKEGGVQITGVYQGFVKLNKVTTNIKEAISGVELIMPVVPANAHKPFAEALARYLEDGQFIVLVPGSTWGALELHNVLKRMGVKKNVKIAETSTLMYVCRLLGPAWISVKLAKNRFWFAAFPGKYTGEVVDIFKELYPNVTPVDHTGVTALYNTNPVSHAASIICNAGRIEYVYGQRKGSCYVTGEEFYFAREGITPSVARAIESTDNERNALCDALGYRKIPIVQSLYEQRFVSSPASSTYDAYHSETFSGPLASKGPTSLDVRMLTEDVRYGIVSWASLGEMLGVPTPTMRALIQIASVLTGTDYWKEGVRSVEKLGISGMSAERLNKYLETGD